jgi:uncharacterized repeat protein (TIGR03803 family)
MEGAIYERNAYMKRRTSMKRIINALNKLNRGKRAYAVLVLCATTAMALSAQTFTTLHSFDLTDGAYVVAGLVQATNGDLYGTTGSGGTNGSGTVFKITPNGTLTTLYSFCSQSNCTDGAGPNQLIQATNGDFYGTASSGGANGSGTIFKITPSGTLTTLYSFCSQSGCLDGSGPYAGLVQATNGDLYGTTADGGANPFGGGLGGTVFKITPSGTLTTLYSFCSQIGCADGQAPLTVLVQAPNGDFYGTTEHGGFSCAGPPGIGCGTIFKITPGGTLTTLFAFPLCSQSGCTDGLYPSALVRATNGNFYGTTSNGGSPTDSAGTVFKITPGGTLTTLYTFCSQTNCTDGATPLAGLVQATDGDFYGTTSGGGANPDNPLGGGTIFKITPSGTLTTLYSFCSQSGCADGDGPEAGLVQATNGDFYGTATGGGLSSACYGGCGTVFSLSVGLGPFVETQTASGEVGAVVKILGNDLTGATSVSFNGTEAAFTVVSPSLITATVPAGATSGKVQVVTLNRTLSSNVPFRVLP